MAYSLFRSFAVLRLTRFERVPKAEIYWNQLRKGAITWERSKKVYTKECKGEAVRLAETSGKPIAQIARELGISDSAIHGWRKELAEHGKEAFPGKVHQTALEEENRRLKRELERVQQERDMLKKKQSASSHGNPDEVLAYQTKQSGVSRCGHVPCA